MSKALSTLGLLDSATPQEVKARWRELCSIHHPDRDGNAVEFNTYRRAYQTAIVEVSAPKVCARCQGTGKSSVTAGFNTISLPCVQCGGLGHTSLEVQNG